MTRSPGPSLSTRTRCRVSSASKATRSPSIRSGEIVKRRTEPEGRPALERDMVGRRETFAAQALTHGVGLGVEDAAEQQRPARRQQAAVVRGESRVGGGEEIR